MSSRKQQSVGRTPWDLLNSLFQRRKAATWVAAVASLLVVLGIVAIWRGYLKVQFNPTEGSDSRTCADYGFSFLGGEQRIASAKARLQVQIKGPQLPDRVPWLVFTTFRGSKEGYWGPLPCHFVDSVWTVDVPGHKTGKAGEKQYYAIFLVGKDGEALFRAYRNTMLQLSPDGMPPWPRYKERTSDMLECPELLEVKFE